MDFFNSAVDVLQTLVIALGAGLGIWGVINLLEGYGNDNPGAKSYGIKKAALFGSVARGQNTPDSDVDLVVSFGKKYDLLDIVGLKQDLEEALQVPFDVITYESLKSGAFADSVYTDERVIYG